MAYGVEDQSANIVDDINKLNIFGPLKKEDLLFRSNEEEEKERKFRERQREREREIERQIKQRKNEEVAYKEFLNEHQRKELRKRNDSSQRKARGRGAILSMGFDQMDEMKPRGRGRLSPKEIKSIPLVVRSEKVKKNLIQSTESNYHNNTFQKMYWTGRKLENEEEEEEEEDEEDYYHNMVDSNIGFTDCESNLSIASSPSEQYEDAQSSPCTSSFNSLSRSSCSPMSAPSPFPEMAPPAGPPKDPAALLPLQPYPYHEAASPSSRTRKPRVSRLAARFSNNIEEDAGEGTSNSGRDPFAVLKSSRSHPTPSKVTMAGRLSSGVSFNSLNASQRVLSNNLLRPEDLCPANFGGFSEDAPNINSLKDFPEL